MRLTELSIQPIENTGWGSGPLIFGEDITQLYGPNGCGKTPVIHSIAFAMGYPVCYRDDILAHCESVTLKAVHNDKVITFLRQMSKDFHVECSVSDQEETRIFYNEEDMSKFLLDFLGLSISALTSISNEPTYPYSSTFLPLFYVDQDSGYTSAYKAPNNFIKDQYAEMIRLSLGVPAKHSYESKKHLITKKNELSGLVVSIVSSEEFIGQLIEQASGNIYDTSEVDHKLEVLKLELDELRSNYDATSSAGSVMASIVNEKLADKRIIDFKIHEIEGRISDFNKIENEIEIEINTLSLNEESRRVFSSFNDICSNTGCQLFLGSSESYGKNLLYLRDQMKDLERNSKYQEVRLGEFIQRSNKLEEEINSLKANIAKDQQEGSSLSLVNTISEITKSIIDLQSSKEIISRIASEKKAHNELLRRRMGLQDDIAALSDNVGSSDLRSLEFRTIFKTKIIEWLDVLSTKNVSRDITVDADFNVIFGGEKLSQLSGSTLLRVVLALKSAFFEVYLSRETPTIKFLIFDTPKQHDIESEHFAAFIKKLKNLVADQKAQIIFSTTEYHYENQENDIEWVPQFPNVEQNMFLGTIEQLSE